MTPRATFLALVSAPLLALALSGCSKSGAKDDTSAPKPLLLAQEDVLQMGLSSFASGPVITGSIQPAKLADMRAEVQAVVLQVLKENGEKVRKGDLLVRLDDSSIRENVSSADEAARAANQSFEQAERQFQRLKTLQAQGMSSIQAMEDAEIRRNNAQSDWVAAKARVAAARQQLQRTEVRAPFDGVLSDRKVSAGDTAQIGKELVKVIDPTSMRFEGLVSADRMEELKLGEAVHFHVNGYGDADFAGSVQRIAAAANATTRQVEVLVSFAGEPRPTVAGLYAEGHVQSSSVSALMLPEAAIAREGDKAYAWKIAGDKLVKQPLKLGSRDERAGDWQIASGLAQGDKVLRHPNSLLSDGRAIEMNKLAAPVASAASSGG
jgi:RND family efflux transporter MFP subunit